MGSAKHTVVLFFFTIALLFCHFRSFTSKIELQSSFSTIYIYCSFSKLLQVAESWVGSRAKTTCCFRLSWQIICISKMNSNPLLLEPFYKILRTVAKTWCNQIQPRCFACVTFVTDRFPFNLGSCAPIKAKVSIRTTKWNKYSFSRQNLLDDLIGIRHPSYWLDFLKA